MHARFATHFFADSSGSKRQRIAKHDLPNCAEPRLRRLRRVSLTRATSRERHRSQTRQHIGLNQNWPIGFQLSTRKHEHYDYVHVAGQWGRGSLPAPRLAIPPGQLPHTDPCVRSMRATDPLPVHAHRSLTRAALCSAAGHHGKSKQHEQGSRFQNFIFYFQSDRAARSGL